MVFATNELAADAAVNAVASVASTPRNGIETPGMGPSFGTQPTMPGGHAKV